MSIRAEGFTTYFQGLSYKERGEVCTGATLDQVIALCSARALYDGEQQALSYRAAWQDEKILIDTGTDDWTAVEVSPAGTRIVHLQKNPFKRFPHMQALPPPEAGGQLRDIFDLIPCRDPHSQSLLEVWLPCALIPDIPRPGLILTGTQGSGKTFACEILRELIDPSVIKTLSLPRGEAELVQCLDHHFLAPFDNVDFLPDWASDILCRAVTGEGYMKRELYSDDNDFVYRFHRLFIINSIAPCARRADLLDRSLLIELQRIRPEDRKSLRQLEAQFSELKPKIFGAMLDTLSYALRSRQEDAVTDPPPRLVDWFEYAYPASENSTFGQAGFMVALRKNEQQQHEEITTSDPLAVTIIHFMSDQSVWRGTASELLGQLNPVATELNLLRARGWPGAANNLSRRLRQIQHNLSQVNLEVTFSKGKNPRTIELRMDPRKITGASPSSPSR
jgi:hypothetical protein